MATFLPRNHGRSWPLVLAFVVAIVVPLVIGHLHGPAPSTVARASMWTTWIVGLVWRG